MDGILVSFGGSIKSLEKQGDLVTLGDYGILWGSKEQRDLRGDYYTKSTNLGARAGLGVDTMLHHGIPLSRNLKAYSDILLPPTIKAEVDDHGLLVATVLDLRDAYQRKMYELCEEGAFSWSSGANARGVRRRDNVKCGEVVQWPIMEFSFTPTPCEPRMSGIAQLDEIKSIPEDWFEKPNYAKTVRVLRDFKDGTDTPEPEVKSVLFPYDDGVSATAAVAREATDRLVYNVLYQVFSPSMYPSDGLTTQIPATPEERLTYLKNALAEYGDFVYRVAETILTLQGEQEPEAAAKSLRSDYLSLKAALPEKMSFADHSDTVLATCEEFMERTDDLVGLRAGSRKSGQPLLSQANFERFDAVSASMKALVTKAETLRERATNEGDQSEGATKSIEAELLELELRFRENEFESVV